MHQQTELSFVNEFRWVSPLHYLKNGWQNAVLRWCMLQAGLPSLHYYCVVVLHSCILLTPVGHSSNHEYHCCQLTRQLSCVSNFYHTLKVLIWLSHIKYSCVVLKTFCPWSKTVNHIGLVTQRLAIPNQHTSKHHGFIHNFGSPWHIRYPL
jgi:hypothetical protein